MPAKATFRDPQITITLKTTGKSVDLPNEVDLSKVGRMHQVQQMMYQAVRDRIVEAAEHLSPDLDDYCFHYTFYADVVDSDGEEFTYLVDTKSVHPWTKMGYQMNITEAKQEGV